MSEGTMKSTFLPCFTISVVLRVQEGSPLMLSALEEVWDSFLLLPSSGASRATASGRRRNSLTARMAAGAPGPSLARAPGPAGEACDPAAAAATTHRMSGFCLPPFPQLEVAASQRFLALPLVGRDGDIRSRGAVPCIGALSCTPSPLQHSYNPPGLFSSPAYGGRQCPGATYEYQVCNAEECPGPFQDFRAQQCSKRNSYYTHQNSKHSWLPYEHHDGEWWQVLAKEQ